MINSCNGVRQRGGIVFALPLLFLGVSSYLIASINLEIANERKHVENAQFLTTDEQAVLAAENFYSENPDYNNWVAIDAENFINQDIVEEFSVSVTDEDTDSLGYKYRSLILKQVKPAEGKELYVDGVRIQAAARAAAFKRMEQVAVFFKSFKNYQKEFYRDFSMNSKDLNIYYASVCDSNTAVTTVECATSPDWEPLSEAEFIPVNLRETLFGKIEYLLKGDIDNSNLTLTLDENSSAGVVMRVKLPGAEHLYFVEYN